MKEKIFLIRDAKKWLIGGYFIPNYASFTNFWSRVVYRFGFRNEQMSTLFNNIPLTETGHIFWPWFAVGRFVKRKCRFRN